MKQESVSRQYWQTLLGVAALGRSRNVLFGSGTWAAPMDSEPD